MEPIGQPLSIQNTDGGYWLIDCPECIASPTESISFTVAIRRDASMTIGQVQQAAMRRALELLQQALPD